MLMPKPSYGDFKQTIFDLVIKYNYNLHGTYSLMRFHQFTLIL